MITCEINVKGGNESEAPDGFIAAVVLEIDGIPLP
jgi:hypothetical protein